LAGFGLYAEGRGQPVKEGLLRLEGSLTCVSLLCHSIQIKNVQQISNRQINVHQSDHCHQQLFKQTNTPIINEAGPLATNWPHQQRPHLFFMNFQSLVLAFLHYFKEVMTEG
jgi:hypothetical protein